MFSAGARSSNRKEDSGSDSDTEAVQETDAERRKALEESRKAEDDCYLGKGLGWKDFEDEFSFAALHPGSSGFRRQHCGTIDLMDNSDVLDGGTVCSESTGRFPGKKKVKDDHRKLGQPLEILNRQSKSTSPVGEWDCLVCTL